MATTVKKKTIKKKTRRTPRRTAKSLGDRDGEKYDDLSREELIKLLLLRDKDESGGIRLTYTGQAPPWQIVRRVKPRRQRIVSKYCVGSEEDQANDLLVEGENLQAMVSLYKFRGQVNLILTDPPYNTGNDFRYNDKWDEDPNDPDLGSLVPKEDGSRHSKWLRFMTPRIWMMKEMLAPGGIIAICIDHRELFRLGMLLDQVFGNENQLAIINWQKSYAPKNNVGKRTHVSSSTEYVLVYAKSIDRANTNLLPRSDKQNARYTSPDGDPEPWTSENLTGPGAETHAGQVYGVQNPFTGDMGYPAEGRCWAAERTRMKAMVEDWGSQYVSKDVKDGKSPALVIKGSLAAAKKKAEKLLQNGPWPIGHWLDAGKGALRIKSYLKDVKRGVVAMTYWADEDYDDPIVLESTSWDHEQSGHSQTGLRELNDIVGRGHKFDTVKPLKLFKKIIQLWCPPSGIVLDPFAGSGTTGHAVLSLNDDSDAARRFILIEQGRPEKGDTYARSLTSERLSRAISGEREGKTKAKPLPGGFRFTQLMKKVDGEAVLALEREEMIDLMLTSHWDQDERASSYLKRLPAGRFGFLIATSGKGEGYFLVWNGPNQKSVLDRKAFRGIAEDAKAAKLKGKFHIYAQICTYSGPNIEFYQIPHRILDKLGFNEATEPFAGGEA